MRDLQKAINNCKTLIFIDLEGAQFSHEMIEIGAYKATLDNNFNIKKIFRGYKTYVKSKAKVGKVVTELTGITDKKLEMFGVPYRVALEGLIKYIGKKDYHKCLFVTFGSFDKTIFLSAAEHNKDASMPETRYITHKILDYSDFISHYVRDEHGNPYSLVNYLKLFGVDFRGTEHDASDDALNLALLYKAFLDHPEIVKEEYKKVLAKNHKLPTPIRLVMDKLNAGESVSPDEYDLLIEESLK